jgi:hypothetical protein
MLCANRHPNPEGARFCQTCGTNEFIVTSLAPPYAPAPQYAPASPYNGLAIASIVLVVFFIPIATPVAQIVLGNKARTQIRTTKEQGDGLALAAIIIGWLGLVVSVIFLVFVIVAIVAISHAPSTPPNPFP